MRNYRVAIFVASALTTSIVLITQKAQAQNPSPQTTAGIVAAVDATNTNKRQTEGSAIFITEIPEGLSRLEADCREPANSSQGQPIACVNMQFMVKDSKKYAATGGWGFGDFTSGKPGSATLMKTCFACHVPAKDHDFVFTRYSPSTEIRNN